MLQPLLTCGTAHTSTSEIALFQKGLRGQAKPIPRRLNVRINGWYHDDCIRFYIQSIVQTAWKKLTCGEIWFDLLILAIQAVHLIVTEAVCMQTHPSLTAKTIASATWHTHTQNTVWERRLWSCTRLICECLFDLRSQHISSLRSPQSSMPSQVWLRDTHLVFTHLKPHSSPGTPERAKV